MKDTREEEEVMKCVKSVNGEVKGARTKRQTCSMRREDEEKEEENEMEGGGEEEKVERGCRQTLCSLQLTLYN